VSCAEILDIGEAMVLCLDLFITEGEFYLVLSASLIT
jgi:hypothetical protein